MTNTSTAPIPEIIIGADQADTIAAALEFADDAWRSRLDDEAAEDVELVGVVQDALRRGQSIRVES